MLRPRFDLPGFDEEPVMGIIRGITGDSLQAVMETLITAGLRFVEITLNTHNALPLLETSVSLYSEMLTLGAGTVLSVADAESAFSAGARFLVGPTFSDGVANFCRERQLAYFPGALTPTEIERGWNAGASMVKVFPASQMGASYFKVVHGPFPNIKLMAVGGVNSENVNSYLQAGASAVALGGSILSPERMKNKELSLIRKETEDFLFAVRNFFSTMNT